MANRLPSVFSVVQEFLNRLVNCLVNYWWLFAFELSIILLTASLLYSNTPVVYESGAAVFIDPSRKQFFEPVAMKVYSSPSHVRKENLVQLLSSQDPLQLFRKKLELYFEKNGKPTYLDPLMQSDLFKNFPVGNRLIRMEKSQTSDVYYLFCRAPNPHAAQTACHIYLDTIVEYFLERTVASLREEISFYVDEFNHLSDVQKNEVRKTPQYLLEKLGAVERYYIEELSKDQPDFKSSISMDISQRRIEAKLDLEKIRVNSELNQLEAFGLEKFIDKIEPHVVSLERSFSNRNLGIYRILEPTFSNHRASPKITKFVMALISVVGFFFAITAVLLMSRFQRIISEGQADSLGIPILGRIPRMRCSRINDGQNSKSQFDEYLLVANQPLWKKIDDVKAKVIVICSPREAEGKTFVANQLTSILLGRGRSCFVDGIQPPFDKLLSGGQIVSFLDNLKKEFTWIVIDTPALFKSHVGTQWLGYADLIVIPIRFYRTRPKEVFETHSICSNFSRAPVVGILNDIGVNSVTGEETLLARLCSNKYLTKKFYAGFLHSANERA